MTLRAGANLGHFEIIGLLGIGGMGEVYHARDLKLGREVAVKVLPARVADDENLLSRFEREARSLAALNHPNIAALYSVEREGDMPFLVMELVGGRTLQDRLRGGSMPQSEVLLIFEQIAEALEAAHERGIIHRDLKPANIKITEDDRVKILDFGLAKAFESDDQPASSGGTISLEPQSDLTAEGAIIGTLVYMSPEQARGRPVDKRTDIWAFGCMLYEALTGKPPFRGETGSDTIAQILEREPEWDELPKDTPARVRELLWRCLQKDPRRRLRDIGEAWFGIREHQSSSTSGPFAAPPTTSERKSSPMVLGLMMLAAAGMGLAGGAVLFSGRTDSNADGSAPGGVDAGKKEVRRFTVDLVAPLMMSPVTPFFALSPDGSQLAYATRGGAHKGLFLRSLERFEAEAFEGTEDAYAPFFSPDGQWIGMMRNQGRSLQILKVPVGGGMPTVVASTAAGPQSGQDWGDGDLIVINPKVRSPLVSVRGSGGNLEPLTTLDTERGEAMHLYPQILPGGKAVLFTAVGSDENGQTLGGIELMFLDTGERKTILNGAAFGRYVPSGHLLYVPYDAGTAPDYVAGVAFDLETMETVGRAGTPVLDDVYIHSVSYFAQFDVADDGTLAYLPDVRRQMEVVWVDRQGIVESAGLPLRDYRGPRLSPDGRKIAVAIDEGTREDAWVYDLARTSLSRLTMSGSAHSPLWHPNGTELIVASGRDRFVNLFRVDAGGGGIREPLSRTAAFECPTSISADGSVMTWSALDLESSSYNVGVGMPTAESQPPPYFDSPLWEMWPAISPDGEWVAFVSNRTGDPEVYVAPYPGPGPISQISNKGGVEPLWSDEGDELFYRQGESMFSVAVDFDGTPKFGIPEKLFEGRFLMAEAGFSHEYDVTPDGRFLMIRSVEAGGKIDSGIQRINVVLNWLEELNALIPPSGSGN